MSTEDFITIMPVDKVKPNAWNVNVMPEALYVEMVENVRGLGIGILDPIAVRPIGGIGGDYEIVDGYHRWKAVQDAGFSQVRTTILQVTEDEAKAINYRKNRERGTIDPFKEALLFMSEKTPEKEWKEIADKYGVSKQHVHERIQLLGISDKVLGILSSTHVCTGSHLEALASLRNEEAQLLLAKEIVSRVQNGEKVTVRWLEEQVHELKQRFKPVVPEEEKTVDQKIDELAAEAGVTDEDVEAFRQSVYRSIYSFIKVPAEASKAAEEKRRLFFGIPLSSLKIFKITRIRSRHIYCPNQSCGHEIPLKNLHCPGCARRLKSIQILGEQVKGSGDPEEIRKALEKDLKKLSKEN